MPLHVVRNPPPPTTMLSLYPLWAPSALLAKGLSSMLSPPFVGNYGTVYKGRCRGYPVAIKVLHNQQLTQHKIEELQREVEIMK